MVQTAQIGRKLARKRAHKPKPDMPITPMTGSQAIAYWKTIPGGSVYADRERFPQDAPELARLLREQSLKTVPPPPPGALAALMEEWRAEDAAMSEEEAEEADRDTEEFKANMNANRAATGERPVYR